MKRIILLIMLLIAGKLCHAKDAVGLELYADSKKTGGLKLSIPFADFRTAFGEEKFNLGLMLSSNCLTRKFPVEIKVGNLSGSGSLSKLNSPELNKGTSPFSNSLLYTNAINVNLPSYSSFSKPDSVFVQIKMQNHLKNHLNLTINTWFSPDYSSPVFSVLYYGSFLSKQFNVKASLTAGQFFYEENDSSAWFLLSPYYQSDNHFCSLIQLSGEIKSKSHKAAFYTGLTTAVYESPFGPYTAAYRADLKLSLKKIELFTSAFLNPYDELLTSSDKQINPVLQIKTGLIAKKAFLMKNAELLLFKFGINLFTSINLTEENHPVKINAGFQLTTNLTSFSLSLSADALITAASIYKAPRQFSPTSISCQIKNSWYLKSFTPGMTFNIEKNINDAIDTVKYKTSLNLTYNSKHKLNSNCSFSFTSKGFEITDKKVSAALSARFNIKALTIIGKLSFSQGL